MSTEIHSRRGLERHRENPFWQPTQVTVGKRHITVAGGMHISNEGEAVQHSGVHIVTEVDKDEFVKLYTKNMRIFFDLKPATQKVLQVVLDAVQKTPNTDCIYLHWFGVEEYTVANGTTISKASFHNAMKELLVKKFIAEAVEPHKFWINPHLFFNGDRMSFVREYRIKTEKEVKDKTRAISEEVNFGGKHSDSDE
jgi:hypothetical protein